MKQALVAGAALVTIGLGAAALVQASGSSEKDDAVVTGAQAEKAKAAALRVTKGTAGAVERDGDGGTAWEVEVTKPGGETVDIELDENLKVVADEREEDEGKSEQDADEGNGEQDEDEGKSEQDAGERDGS